MTVAQRHNADAIFAEFFKNNLVNCVVMWSNRRCITTNNSIKALHGVYKKPLKDKPPGDESIDSCRRDNLQNKCKSYRRQPFCLKTNSPKGSKNE